MTEHAEETPTETQTEQSDPFEIDAERLESFLQWATLAVLLGVAFLSAIGLYQSLQSIIDIWVSVDYQPIARAGLNVALLSGALAGIIVIVRRLSS